MQRAPEGARSLSLHVALSTPTHAGVGIETLRLWSRHLIQGNVEVASPPPSTTPTSAPTANGTALLPPTALTPEPSSKESIQDKWKHLEEGKSPAEKGIAITIGVIMLVGILTCLGKMDSF